MKNTQKIMLVFGGTLIFLSFLSYSISLRSVRAWLFTGENLFFSFCIFMIFMVGIFIVLGILFSDAITSRFRSRVFRKKLEAYLHDSVLQNLAVIQNISTEPKVRAIARQQERQLRKFLYYDNSKNSQNPQLSEESLAHALESIVSNFEIESNQEIAFNFVGDITRADFGNEQFDAVKHAVTQAIQNALQHGKPKYSVTIEADQNTVRAYIRDHGNGFDVNKVAKDRLGVKVSIIEQIADVGGTVQIKSKKNFGTEIEILFTAH